MSGPRRSRSCRRNSLHKERKGVLRVISVRAFPAPRDGSLTALFLPVPCLFRIRLDIRLEIDAALSALQFSGNQGLRRGQDRDVAGGKGYGAEQRSRFARTAVKGELDRKGPVSGVFQGGCDIRTPEAEGHYADLLSSPRMHAMSFGTEQAGELPFSKPALPSAGCCCYSQQCCPRLSRCGYSQASP